MFSILTHLRPSSPASAASGVPTGIVVLKSPDEPARHTEHALTGLLEQAGLRQPVRLQTVHTAAGEAVALDMAWPAPARQLPVAHGRDTLGLQANLEFYCEGSGRELWRETLLALMLSLRPCVFPSVAELASALSVRVNIAQAARRSQLEFRTATAERPSDCWDYDEERGFTIRPGCSLVESLRKATEPELTGRSYSFSCYRATEYLILLGLAEELQGCNPVLHDRLEAQWQRRAIASGQFHDVFLRETGTLDDPVPARYYVPGDRVWFRNPDEPSSDASGYEGSWTLYLGGGEFANLWNREHPYTLEDKCLEIHHWRDGLYTDAAGDPRIDETRVAAHVARSRDDPQTRAAILARMQRLRDPKGVYAEGGCIDATREAPRWICPGTCDLDLPAH